MGGGARVQDVEKRALGLGARGGIENAGLGHACIVPEDLRADAAHTWPSSKRRGTTA